MDSAFENDKYSDLMQKIEVIEENNFKKYYLNTFEREIPHAFSGGSMSERLNCA